MAGGNWLGAAVVAVFLTAGVTATAATLATAAVTARADGVERRVPGALIRVTALTDAARPCAAL
jgi:hypothetical protein